MARGLKMTTLTQLIEHYCPDSVECVKLGDVAIRQRGIAITAAKMRELDSPNGGIVVFGAGATRALIDSSEIASTNIHTKDSVIVKARGHVGFEMCTVPFTTKSELWSYRSDDPKLNIRYGYYFLSEHSGELAEIARLNGVKLPQLKVSDTDNYLIPLPPREVQDAIVERLDAFAALVESLDSEIVLREKRFEYFREQLLSFDESDCVECARLGDVAEYSSLRVDSVDLNADTFVGVDNLLKDRGGKTLSEHGPNTKRSTKYQVGDVLLGNIRPYLRKIWHATNEGGCSGDVLAIHPSKVYSRFLYWTLFGDEFWHYNNNFSRGGKMPRGDKSAILAYQFPLPSLAVQQDIADKLDTMQALIDNLKYERDLRKAQFEYYREKLLTFNS